MTNDDTKPRRLRDVAEEIAAKIFDPSRRHHDVSDEPRIPKGQPGGGQWTTESAAGANTRKLANSHTPAPFLDDHDRPVLTGDRKPIQRPSDVDMKFFADQGLAAKASSLVAAYAELFNFHQEGDWDIQRVGSDTRPSPAFIDAANVAIGIYGAAAGLPQDTVLAIVNDAGAAESDFKDAPRDRTYTHLRKQNVDDVKLGYTLFQSGRIGPSKTKVRGAGVAD